MKQTWIIDHEESRGAVPMITTALPLPLPGLMAQDVMSWELRLGDVVPFDITVDMGF
ncbi:hypothetical protein [Streptomyces sp. NPDC058671]|uniref:hypothetical protein n=1 Tax=Streptomyces sp. NPDC058671 TaxID=3346590 RepID=UPI0036547AC7